MKKISIFERLSLALIDIIIFFPIAFFLFLLNGILNKYIFSISTITAINIDNVALGMFFIVSLFFSKDMVKSRSLAKRMLGFQIVTVKNNEPAGSIRCLIRNLSLVISPVEFIFLIFNKERRIGDFIAGTQLVRYEKQYNKSIFIIDFRDCVLSIMIGFIWLIVCVLAYGIINGFVLINDFQNPSIYSQKYYSDKDEYPKMELNRDLKRLIEANLIKKFTDLVEQNLEVRQVTQFKRTEVQIFGTLKFHCPINETEQKQKAIKNFLKEYLDSMIGEGFYKGGLYIEIIDKKSFTQKSFHISLSAL